MLLGISLRPIEGLDYQHCAQETADRMGPGASDRTLFIPVWCFAGVLRGGFVSILGRCTPLIRGSVGAAFQVV